MSRVRIEFLGHVRTLAGVRNSVIPLTGNDTPLSSVLKRAEETYGNLRLFEEERLLDGIIVFRRRVTGGLERIDDFDLPAVEEGKAEEEYVIATGMEGG